MQLILFPPQIFQCLNFLGYSGRESKTQQKWQKYILTSVLNKDRSFPILRTQVEVLHLLLHEVSKPSSPNQLGHRHNSCPRQADNRIVKHSLISSREMVGSVATGMGLPHLKTLRCCVPYTVRQVSYCSIRPGGKRLSIHNFLRHCVRS